MKVLLITQLYTSRDLQGISMFNFFMDMISLVNSVRDDIEWYVAVPEKKGLTTWDDSIFDESKHIHAVPILQNIGTVSVGGEANRDFERDGFCGEQHALYGPAAYRFFASQDSRDFDVVLDNFYHCSVIAQFQGLRYLFDHQLSPKYVPPTLVNLMTESTLYKGDLRKIEHPAGEQLMFASAASADRVLVLTPEDEIYLKTRAKCCLASSVCKKLKFEPVLPVVDFSKVPVYEDRPIDRKVFFHGGGFSSRRHLSQIKKIIDGLYGTDAEVKLLLTTQGSEPKLTAEKWISSACEPRYEVTRSDYLKYLAEGDFSLCWVEYEGTGLAYLEAVASGMTPIWVDKKWMRGRLPDDYEFLVSDSDFQRALYYAARHPEDVKEKGKKAIEYIRNKFSRLSQATYWSNFLDECFQKRLSRVNPSVFFDIAKDAYSNLGDEFSKDELIEALADASEKLEKGTFKNNYASMALMIQKLGAIRYPNEKFVKTRPNCN